MRAIVIGDVHGCLDELDELLRIVEYRQEADRLYFVGDLVDRGPDPVGVVRRVRELHAECARGNHEEKHVRWARREAERRATGKPNPMRPLAEKVLREHETLGDDNLAWMAALPLVIEPVPGWVIVHAGFEPDRPVWQQNPNVCMRVRYVDQRDRMKSGDPYSKPAGAVRWATRWPGRENVIYGHAVHDMADATVDEPQESVRCYGIDTGCCFGGRLTALVMPRRQSVSYDDVSFVQVQARAAYHPFTPPED